MTADHATATPASSATGVVLARQPILDADLNVQAFELLYRAVGEDGRPIDGGRATATVLVAALADVGLQRLVGDKRAFLNVDREFLMTFRPLPLPADRVVLELVEDQLIDDDLLAVLAEVKDAGFAPRSTTSTTAPSTHRCSSSPTWPSSTSRR